MDEQTKNITHTGYPTTHPGRIVDCDLCMSSDEALPKPGSEPLSVVQRTQIREQITVILKSVYEEGRSDQSYNQYAGDKWFETPVNDLLSAISLILGDNDGS